jgi:hypothetical protein
MNLAPYQVRKYDTGWFVVNTDNKKIAGWFDETEDRPLRQAELLRNKLNSKHGLDKIGV